MKYSLIPRELPRAKHKGTSSALCCAIHLLSAHLDTTSNFSTQDICSIFDKDTGLKCVFYMCHNFHGQKLRLPLISFEYFFISFNRFSITFH